MGTHLLLLAAGEGQRLRPLTQDKPKCLVEFRGQPMLSYGLKAAAAAGFAPDSVHVIAGYQAEVLTNWLSPHQGISVHINPLFSQANMLSSLHIGLKALPHADDLVISYTDIVYKASVLQLLMDSDADAAVVADRDWKSLWQCRMEDPLRDAETFQCRASGALEDIGRRPRGMHEIEAQYIGLLRFKGPALLIVRDLLDFMHDKAFTAYSRAYMTDLLQILIRMHVVVTPVYIAGGWLEVDTLDDLRNLTHDERFHF